MQHSALSNAHHRHPSRLRWLSWLLLSLALLLVMTISQSSALPQHQPTSTTSRSLNDSPIPIPAAKPAFVNIPLVPTDNNDKEDKSKRREPEKARPSDGVQASAAAATNSGNSPNQPSPQSGTAVDSDSNLKKEDNTLNGLQIGLIVGGSVATVGLVVGLTILLRGIQRFRRRSSDNSNSTSAGMNEAGKSGSSGSDDGAGGTVRHNRRSSASRDLRRSSAIFRSSQRGQRGSVNTFSEVMVEAVPRRTTQRGAIPAPLMLETGQASGVLADADAFPPLPGPARMRDRHPAGSAGRRDGVGSGGDPRRWTVSIDTGDLEVVPLPPPSYPEALRSPPAASD